MTDENRKMLLVGDNPFHGISHLSQEKARDRGDAISHIEYAANLVKASLESGANGFMFSVSETTLSILQTVCKALNNEPLTLYPIVPYAYEYARLATQVGGVPGIAKKFGMQIAFSGNMKAIASGLKGVMEMDPVALMKTYLLFEISRIKSAAGKQSLLGSVMLHEVIADMALALDLDWFFKSYVDFVSKLGTKAGFETRNFTFLVDKFTEWNIDLGKVVVAAPFNSVGFQMNPSKAECEKALTKIPESRVIAISILAAGYLKPPEAVDYLKTLPNLNGVAVGVSKETQAHETFKLLKEKFAL